MVFMQVAHEHLGDFHGIDAMVYQVLMDLQYAVFVAKTQPGVKQYIVTVSDHQKRLYLYQQGTVRTVLQIICAQSERRKPFGSVYRK
ncbi:hypothetical protein [Chitinophaga oryzae]|uniref:hypothetical protein n=1 Tax=Chitinophaga oryzae TaxID=2725414 RepID=UPI001FE730B3|nr:hypothetical protein [Chitinophaga oryzae]